MSRLYDTVEPAVIDEDMLQKAVEEQGPKDEAGRIAKQEGIDFTDVTQLRLDFKSKLLGEIFFKISLYSQYFWNLISLHDYAHYSKWATLRMQI